MAAFTVHTRTSHPATATFDRPVTVRVLLSGGRWKSYDDVTCAWSSAAESTITLMRGRKRLGRFVIAHGQNASQARARKGTRVANGFAVIDGSTMYPDAVPFWNAVYYAETGLSPL